MNELGYGNEKAELKARGFAPIDVGPHAKERAEEAARAPKPAKGPKYVRILLGLGEHVDFLKSLNDRTDKKVFTIKDTDTNKETTIERLQSPILFKIISGKVYMVARRLDIPKGHTFEIKSGDKGIILQVPEVGPEFIDDFMDYCVNHINEKNVDILKEIANTERIIKGGPHK